MLAPFQAQAIPVRQRSKDNAEWRETMFTVTPEPGRRLCV
jgi:hypothetical protein